MLGLAVFEEARDGKAAPRGGAIIGKLREVEVGLAGGREVGELCRSIGISEQTCCPGARGARRPEAGSSEAAEEFGREDARLKRAVADPTLDKL
jgi:hypothetical protein